MNLDLMDLTWDFLMTLAHYKTKNPISFCDNATLTSANLTNSDALFTKEKEIIVKRKDQIIGPKILFLEDLIT